MTTVYLMRHSRALDIDNTHTKDDLQIQNEKKVLAIEGEEIAKKVAESSIFDNIDNVYSSNYTRAIATAKYVAERANVKIQIEDDLGERKFGINSWEELPKEFEKKQFLEEDYKIENGESQKEVRNRMTSIIQKIVEENPNKNIVIVSHATAITFFLKNWCDMEIIDDKLKYSYHGKELLYGYFNNCETFKLIFDEKQLIYIEHITF